MPKVKEPLSVLLRRFAKEDPDSFSTDGKILFCKMCEKEIKISKGFQFSQHKATSGHSAKVEEFKKRKSKKQALIQPLFNQNQQQHDEFSSRVCRAFLSANIPLYKVEHAEIRALFKDFAGRELPYQSTLRKNYVSSEYEKVLQAIRDDIGSHPIWLSTDETTDSRGRYMANVIVGKLTPSEPGKGHLILCRELDVANHGTIVRTVQAALRLLWPTFSDEEVNKVLALVTDAAPYMIKAGKSLKLLYPKMMHVTCLSHAMHRVAEELREKSSSVNSVISSVKKVFVKAPSRVRAFKTMHPELPLPPEPVLTRWGTWILAALYYAENHRAIEEVINTFDEADSKYIAKAKAAFKMKDLMPSLTFIKAHMSVIPEVILKLESRGMELVEVVATIQGVIQKADSWPGETGKTVKQKLEFVLARNPGWRAALDLERMLRGESATSEDFLNYSAQEAASLKYLPLVSVDVERSFSSLKRLLTDLRKSLTTENIEKILVVQTNVDLLH